MPNTLFGGSVRFPFLIQLIGIDSVVPDAVKSASDGCHGIHKGVGRPDDEDGVFLSKSLSAADAVVVAATYAFADKELQNTANQRDNQYQHKAPHRYSAMHQRPCGYGQSKRQSHHPQVEGQIFDTGNQLQQLGEQEPHNPRQKEREHQQRKNLFYNDKERMPEAVADSRIDKRDERRHNNCRHHVADDGVGDKCERVAAELVGNDNGGGGRGADEANHGALYHNLRFGIAHKPENQRQRDECSGLYQCQPQVPAARTDFCRVNLAKRDEKHTEQQRWLHNGDNTVGSMVHRCRQRQPHKNKVRHNAAQHDYRQRPIFHKSDNTPHSKC